MTAKMQALVHQQWRYTLLPLAVAWPVLLLWVVIMRDFVTNHLIYPKVTVMPVPLLGVWLLVGLIVAAKQSAAMIRYGVACGVNRRHIAAGLAIVWAAGALFVAVSLGLWELADQRQTPNSLAQFHLVGGLGADIGLIFTLMVIAALAGVLLTLLPMAAGPRWMNLVGMGLFLMVVIIGVLAPALSRLGLSTASFISGGVVLGVVLSAANFALLLHIEPW